MGWVRDLISMIIGIILYRGSMLRLGRMSKVSAMWKLGGHKVGEDIDIDRCCYKALDVLLGRKERIERELCRRHLNSGYLFLYDISSVYFERVCRWSKIGGI